MLTQNNKQDRDIFALETLSCAPILLRTFGWSSQSFVRNALWYKRQGDIVKRNSDMQLLDNTDSLCLKCPQLNHVQPSHARPKDVTFTGLHGLMPMYSTFISKSMVYSPSSLYVILKS